jgi:hypothetical protein
MANPLPIFTITYSNGATRYADSYLLSPGHVLFKSNDGRGLVLSIGELRPDNIQIVNNQTQTDVTADFYHMLNNLTPEQLHLQEQQEAALKTQENAYFEAQAYSEEQMKRAQQGLPQETPQEAARRKTLWEQEQLGLARIELDQRREL